MTAELGNIEKRVLLALGRIGDRATPEQIKEAGGFREMVEVMNGSSWLQAKGLVRHEETLTVWIGLGKEGKAAAERRLPERRAVEALRAHGGEGTLRQLVEWGAILPEERSIAVGWLKRKSLAALGKRDGDTLVTLIQQAHDRTADEAVLDAIARAAAEGRDAREADLDAQGLKLLLQRQNVLKRREEITRIIHLTEKGRRALAAGLEVKETITQLTPELIGSGRWKDAEIQPYDVRAFAPVAHAGKKHPMRQIIDQIREIFLQMGFTEIEGPYVRDAFWNMDVLFTPQDHPARAMQDTFYLSPPLERGKLADAALVERVKAVHERGGDTGSKGWRNPWSPEVAAQLLLRTHTTVDTIQHLARHPTPPVKIFSVDRVFRNEAVDATHLPEFHQVEGVVMEEGANLRQLIGLLKEFYAKMGFAKVVVRPSYYPYTEPSLDIAVEWNGRWLELGGAGMFRPEVLAPVGVKHPVLAWGMGLERLAMMVLGLKDLRELYVSDVEWLRNAPLI